MLIFIVSKMSVMCLVPVVIGWGSTEESFPASDQSDLLQQLDVTVNSSTKYFYLIETNVGKFGADPCFGDSGGPLLLREEDQKWTLIATLLGGGFECGAFDRRDNTSEWNKIAIHMPWIRSVIAGWCRHIGAFTVFGLNESNRDFF